MLRQDTASFASADFSVSRIKSYSMRNHNNLHAYIIVACSARARIIMISNTVVLFAVASTLTYNYHHLSLLFAFAFLAPWSRNNSLKTLIGLASTQRSRKNLSSNLSPNKTTGQRKDSFNLGEVRIQLAFYNIARLLLCQKKRVVHIIASSSHIWVRELVYLWYYHTY